MERHEFEDMDKFVDDIRVSTLKLVQDARDHTKALEQQDKEAFDNASEALRSAGAIIIAGASMMNPMVMAMSGDVIEISSVLFWIGHYLASVPKAEMPEVFKKYMEEKDNG